MMNIMNETAYSSALELFEFMGLETSEQRDAFNFSQVNDLTAVKYAIAVNTNSFGSNLTTNEADAEPE
jgi:hypothetical protein